MKRAIGIMLVLSTLAAAATLALQAWSYRRQVVARLVSQPDRTAFVSIRAGEVSAIRLESDLPELVDRITGAWISCLDNEYREERRLIWRDSRVAGSGAFVLTWFRFPIWVVAALFGLWPTVVIVRFAPGAYVPKTAVAAAAWLAMALLTISAAGHLAGSPVDTKDLAWSQRCRLGPQRDLAVVLAANGVEVSYFTETAANGPLPRIRKSLAGFQLLSTVDPVGGVMLWPAFDGDAFNELTAERAGNLNTITLTRSIKAPLWVPVLLLAAGGAWILARGPIRRHRRRNRGQCLNCGYSMTGLIQPRCPECGEPEESPIERRRSTMC